MGKKVVMNMKAAYMRLADDDGDDEREKINGVPAKGYVPMLVGSTDQKMERFLVHTNLLKHPSMVALLEMAALEFGYEQQGILKIPCDPGYFSRVVEVISK